VTRSFVSRLCKIPGVKIHENLSVCSLLVNPTGLISFSMEWSIVAGGLTSMEDQREEKELPL